MKLTFKSFYIFSLVFAASGQISCAQNTPETSSLLWEISGNGLSSPSWIYGTIHLIGKDDFYVRPAVDSVFMLSKTAAFEIKLNDMAALMSMQQKMELPDGLTISGMMQPEDYKKLKVYLADSLDAEIADFEHKKPLALQQLMITEFIDGETASFELYFLTKCMQLKKEIDGLETLDDQLAVFDSIPYTEQLQWLVDGIDSIGVMESLWDDLTDAYIAEDLETLSKLINESSPEIMQYSDLLLINRNKKWIPEIESLIKSGSVFIAVGAGHLPFDTGVLQLLRNAGYTLKPL